MSSVTFDVSTSTVTTKNSFLRTCGAQLLKLCRLITPSAVNSPVSIMSDAGLQIDASLKMAAINSKVPALAAKLFALGRYLAPCAVCSPVAYLAFAEDSSLYASTALAKEHEHSFGRYLLPSSVNSPVAYMALAYASPLNHSAPSATNAAPVLQHAQGEHTMSTLTDRIINALSAPVTATATVIAQQYTANQEALTSAAAVKAQNFVRPERTLRVGEAIVNALSAPVTATATVIAQQYEAEHKPAATATATASQANQSKIVALDFNAAQAVDSKVLRTNFGPESAVAAYAAQRLARIMPRNVVMDQPVAPSSLPASAESNRYTAAFGEYAALADLSRKFSGMHATPAHQSTVTAVLSQNEQTAADTSRYTAKFGDYAAIAEFARNFAGATTAMSAVLSTKHDSAEEVALPQVTAKSKSYTASFGEYAAMADFARNFAGATTAMNAVLSSMRDSAAELALPQGTQATTAANYNSNYTESFGQYGAMAAFARNFAGATTAMSMLVKAQPQANSNEVIAAIKHEFVLLQAHNAADEAASELNLARSQAVAARWQAIVAQLSAPELKHPVHLGAFNEMQPHQRSA